MRDTNDLLEELHQLHAELRDAKMRDWNRDLPLSELIVDRWERARRLGFGEKASIYDNSYLLGEVKVGKNSWVGPFTMLDGSGGGIFIGDSCAISPGVHIYTHDSVKWALSGGTGARDKAPVHIEDNCYIAANTVIIKGVTIGHHSVVAACSFVNRDVPPYSIVGGSPARPLGKVEIEADGEVHLRFAKPAPVAEGGRKNAA
jgi:acetyltransferase-like isoleucine patch superfamily enzyme